MMQIVKATGAFSDRQFSLLQSTIILKFLAVMIFTYIADRKRNHKFMIAVNLSIASFSLLFFSFAKFIVSKIIRKIFVVFAFTAYNAFIGGTFSLLDTLSYNLIIQMGKPISYYGRIRLGGTFGNIFIHGLLFIVQECWSSFFSGTYKENKNNINIVAGVFFGLLGAFSCLFLPKYVLLDQIPIKREYSEYFQSDQNENTLSENKASLNRDEIRSDTGQEEDGLDDKSEKSAHFQEILDSDKIEHSSNILPSNEGNNQSVNLHSDDLSSFNSENNSNSTNPTQNSLSVNISSTDLLETPNPENNIIEGTKAADDDNYKLNDQSNTKIEKLSDYERASSFKKKKKFNISQIFHTFRSIYSPLLVFYSISVLLQGIDRVALSSFLTYYLEDRDIRRSFLHLTLLLRYLPEIMVYSFSVYLERFVGVDMMFAIAVCLSTFRTFFYSFEDFAFSTNKFALFLLVLIEISKGTYASFMNYSGLRIFRLLSTDKTASFGQGLFAALYNAMSYIFCSPIGFFLIDDDPASRKQNLKLLFKIVGVASLISLITPIYALFNKKWRMRQKNNQ